MKEVMAKGKSVVRGCIKASKGPWVVHRTTKDGIVTKYRFPTDGQRQHNKERERKRRSITNKIFAGLRAHGNYQLPKNDDDRNGLLKALCEEARWHVEEDGSIYKKIATPDISSSSNTSSFQVFVNAHLERQELSRLPIKDFKGEKEIELKLSL